MMMVVGLILLPLIAVGVGAGLGLTYLAAFDIGTWELYIATALTLGVGTMLIVFIRSTLVRVMLILINAALLASILSPVGRWFAELMEVF